MRLSRITTAVLAAVLVTACTEAPTGPESVATPSFSVAAGGPSAEEAVASNHFLVFASGRMPADLAEMVADVDGRLEASYPDLGVAVVSGLEGRAARTLKRSSGAQHVELEPMLGLVEPVSISQPLAAGSAVASPSDPTTASFYPAQWNLRAIHADAAWAAGRLGEASTTIAILDTGIDYLHADLAGRVDLSRSASFVAADDLLAAIYFPNRHPITDLHYHGTHVAATVSSNALAAAGVTSGTTLVGAKVCSVFGGCPGSSVFAGIFHAISVGADVANMSLGGGFSKREYPGFVSAIQRLFNLANQSGLTMVVAAGNAAADLDHIREGFATYCDAANVICVSATGPTGPAGGTFSAGPFTDVDTPAGYTNYGRSSISVAAPGGNVVGVVAACSGSSLVISICQTGTYVLGLGGTSMASPHAAAVAALVSEDVGRNPGLIRQRLHQSSDDLGQRGTDPYYGKGRINAAAAVGGS